MKDQYKILIFSLLMIGFFSYTFLLYNENSSYSSIAISSSDQGKKIWQEKNCIACHQIYGLGGYLGPDLTNAYSFRKNDNYLKAMFNSGIKTMPKFDFNESEKEELLQFLKEIDQTGHYPSTNAKIKPNGWVEIQYKNDVHEN